jgi:hypothetical protein
MRRLIGCIRDTNILHAPTSPDTRGIFAHAAESPQADGRVPANVPVLGVE